MSSTIPTLSLQSYIIDSAEESRYESAKSWRNTTNVLRLALSPVQTEQVFFHKSPWQVYFLECTGNKFYLFVQVFFARVHAMLHVVNIYLTSRSPFVCQDHWSISCLFCTLVKFPLGLAARYTRTNVPNCPTAGMTSFGTRLLGN
jgi:hypothetical protein